jgi:hypothetical protein
VTRPRTPNPDCSNCGGRTYILGGQNHFCSYECYDDFYSDRPDLQPKDLIIHPFIRNPNMDSDRFFGTIITVTLMTAIISAILYLIQPVVLDPVSLGWLMVVAWISTGIAAAGYILKAIWE